MDFSQSSGLIFDCDGTLADTMPLHYVAWRTALERNGIEFTEDRFYSLAGTPTVTIVEILQQEQHVPGDSDMIAHEKEIEFMGMLDQVQPIEPIVEIARKHRETHAMGIGSGSNRGVVEKVVKAIGLEGFFDVIVCAEDTAHHKPEPDVFLEVARRIKTPAEKCCVFEDGDLGLEAARRAGMTSFDIRTVHTPRRISG